jgi:DNA-binding SARP family transcriptional activator
MEFRLLGPFEGPVELPGGKPRALLARLVLDAGRIVAVDTLVEGLWERPPPSATKVLQAHVSALRKALGADAIETRRPGYALREATSDLGRFEVLTEKASSTPDAAERSRLLREALGLWRGDPLAEFRREPFAAAAAGRLAELRLDALTARLGAELELGQHANMLLELDELVAAQPLREEPRRLLMLALYRSGRQAEALATYREGRRALVEALGLEPGPRLQELERAILRQDPALAPSAPVRANRGPIVCVATAPVALLAPLGRELIAVELVASGDALAGASKRLAGLEGARTAAFTSTDPIADAILLARQQGAELLVVPDAAEALLAASPCDVAIVNRVEELGDGPVVVPFGGERREWPALELGSWLAEAHGRPLRLL